MTKNWWFKFEWNDWLGDDELSNCTLETQGFWIRCVAMMHRAGVSEFTGTVEQLRRKFGILPEELTRCLQDLKRNNAANVSFGNGDVSIVSRRLVRELNAKEKNRLQVAKHREKAECKSDVRTQSKSKSKSKEIREERETLSASPPPIKTETKRGFRIPDPFPLTSEMIEWAAGRRPGVDATLETEKFCNYWRAASGRNATKLDWRATWQNWILNAKDYGSNRQITTTNRATNAERLNEYHEVLSEYPSEAELGNIA